MEFNNRSLASLAPRSKPYEVRDPRTRGLLLRVERSGRRSFFFVYARGKRVRLGEYPTVSLTMARSEVPRVLQRLQRGEDPRPPWLQAAVKREHGQTLGEIAAQYARFYRRVKAAQGFNERSLEVLRAAIRGSEDEWALSFDANAWRAQWLAAGNAARTVNRKLDALRSMFVWAIEEGFLTANPVADMRRLPRGNPRRERVRIPEASAEARLREVLGDSPLGLRYLFARNTGLRVSELGALRWDDVDESRIHVRKSKTGHGRWIPLNATARQVLAKLDRMGRYVFGRAEFKKAWRSARAEAEVACSWNECTRHAFASDLLRQGVPGFTVARLLGHGSLQMIETTYGHVTEGDAVAAVEKISRSSW